MGGDIQWDLLGAPGGFAEAVNAGYDRGVKIRENGELDRALATYSDNPADPIARRTIYRLNPKLGVALEDQAFQRAERDRASQFRSAFGSYVLAGRQGPQSSGAFAQGATPDAGAQAAAPSAALGAGMGQPSLPAFAPPVAPPPSPGTILSPPDVRPPPAARPQILSTRDAEWQRMVEADPSKALEGQQAMDQLNDNHVKLASTINAHAIQLLAGVHDQASYDEAKARARDLYGQAGVDFDSLHLPDAYSPAAIDQLTQSALATKDRLAGIREDRKIDWTIQDGQADNARQDRATDSLIGYRSAEVSLGRDRNALTRRGQDMTDSRTRYVHDTPAGRQPTQGTVIGAILTKRATGQPVTPAEQGVLNDYYLGRGGRGGRGRGRMGGGLQDGATATGPGGHTITLRGGRWVDSQTGQPVG